MPLCLPSNGEAKCVDATTPVRNAVAKAYPKLPDTMPTLLIINDDLAPRLNDSLVLVKYALYRTGVPDEGGDRAEDGSFVGQHRQRLGAVGLLDTDLIAGQCEPRYRFTILRNPNALQAAALPLSAFPEYPSYDGLC